MAYTKEQAHEYYVNYTKKGVKKGRSGGKSKSKSSSSKPKKSDEQKAAEKAQLAAIKEKMDAEKQQELEAAKLELNRQLRIKKQMLSKIVSRIKYRYKKKYGDIESGSRRDMMRQDAIDAVKNRFEDTMDIMRSEYRAKTSEIRDKYKDAYNNAKKQVTGST